PVAPTTATFISTFFTLAGDLKKRPPKIWKVVAYLMYKRELTFRQECFLFFFVFFIIVIEVANLISRSFSTK
ncbi:MAG: hypothetical protein ACK5EI_09460, partial [Bacteroidota bacterium]